MATYGQPASPAPRRQPSKARKLSVEELARNSGEINQDEEVICAGRMGFAYQFGYFGLVLAVLWIFLFSMLYIGAATFMVFLFVLAASAVAAWLPKYISDNSFLLLTNRRVLKKIRFIFTDTSESMSIGKVEAVLLRHDLFDKLVGTGTIIIKGTGTTSIVFSGLTNYQRMRANIQQLTGGN